MFDTLTEGALLGKRKIIVDYQTLKRAKAAPIPTECDVGDAFENVTNSMFEPKCNASLASVREWSIPEQQLKLATFAETARLEHDREVPTPQHLGQMVHQSPDLFNRYKRAAPAGCRSSMSGHCLTTLRAQPALSPELARYPKLVQRDRHERMGQTACFIVVAVVVAGTATLPFIFP